jgi:hypothetical protein
MVVKRVTVLWQAGKGGEMDRAHDASMVCRKSEGVTQNLWTCLEMQVAAAAWLSATAQVMRGTFRRRTPQTGCKDRFPHGFRTKTEGRA